MNNFNKRFFAIVLSASVVLSASIPVVFAENEKGKILEREQSYSDYSVEHFADSSAIKNGIEVISDNIRINGKSIKSDFPFFADDILELTVNIPQTDNWLIGIEYKPAENKISDCRFSINVDDNTYNAYLPILKKDANSQYRLDRDGNEVKANQETVKEWVTAVFNDYTDLNKDELSLELKSGIHKIQIRNNTQNINVRKIYIYKPDSLPSYNEYIETVNGKKAIIPIIVEGERYAVTTTTSIRGEALNNPSLYPYETRVKRINTVSSAWASAGEKAVWEFETEESGLYSISFRYLQNADTNMTVYRDMEIDGKTFFKEMNEVIFPHTKSNTYANFTFEINDEPAYIYLEKGKHTIALTATMGPLDKVYDDLLKLMQDINAFGMDINKLASSTVDENRTWDTESYFPNAVTDLKSFANRAEEAYQNLKKICGNEPVFANDLLYAADKLKEVASVPRKIPNKAEDISIGDGSASKYVASVLSKLTNQSIALDRIYVGGEDNLPKAELGFLKLFWESIKQFIFSFIDTYEKEDDSQLKVWMSGSIPYVQVLQQLVDETYNIENGTNIKISIMAGGEQKLVLSNSAGKSPDVVLGVGYDTPFNLAVRGAAKNLLEYDDFLEFYNKEYNLEALIPMCYGDGIYGVTDTQDFQILYYRKDILDSLNIDIPNTWDELKALMPLLLRYNMNVYLPLSTTGMKTMAATGPFFYQYNADFYNSDGLTVAFDSLNGLNAFAGMTEIYNIYSAWQSVPNFYNSFRYGEIPLGISGFGTYMQLELAAPELAGLWGTALSPGVKQEDGQILRYQLADSTASMIMESTNKSEESWLFLKWWLSSETQLSYANLLQNTLGTAYRWNTANLVTFRQLPYPDEMKSIVLKQWESQKENASHPASYMIQREINNAWINVVVNGKGLVESVDSAAVLSNREIKRKLQEFGYYDENGKPTRNYKVWTYYDLLEKLEEERNK